MSLNRRLQTVEALVTGDAPPRRDASHDTLRQKLLDRLVKELGSSLSETSSTPDELRQRVEASLVQALDAERGSLSQEDRRTLIREVSDDVVGLGPLEPLLADDEVSEIMINGPDHVYVERSGVLHRLPSHFVDDAHVRRIIDRIVAQVGRRVDEGTPMVDARLPDGSRVNAVIHPLAIEGPFLTIRKFAKDPFTVEDLIGFGTLSSNAVPFLEACVKGRLNVVVSGGTGTGKTTMLNVLSSFIPSDERVVTIEDAKELQLRQEHVLSMEARPANIEGKGQVTIRDLVRNALRMRPDRIVVGECRAGEALDMLQAMNTGHDGSITTIHSNGPRDTLSRVETMTMMAGFDLPIRAIREQMASALDLIVHITRLRDGTRRVTHITEVQGMEGDIITLQDVFLFDFAAGVNAEGRFVGQLRPTGIRPRCSERLSELGVGFDMGILSEDAPSKTPAAPTARGLTRRRAG